MTMIILKKKFNSIMEKQEIYKLNYIKYDPNNFKMNTPFLVILDKDQEVIYQKEITISTNIYSDITLKTFINFIISDQMYKKFHIM